MSDLSNQTPADTYKGLLQVNDYTDGIAGNTGSSALVIQDGAGNATALAISTDNVGIGTTSPSTTLHTKKGDSSVKFLQDDKAAITLEAGSLADFHISHDGTTNKMYVSHGSVVGSAKLLTINANDGNVGIGTTSPAASLTVAQSATIAGVDLTNACFLAGTATVGIGIDDNEIIKKQGTGGGQLNIGSQGSAASIKFKTGADPTNSDIPYDRMIIDSTGNVGIGTTSPDAKLHIEGNGGLVAAKIKNPTSGDSALKIENSVGQFVISNQNGFLNTLDNTSGTPNSRMTIDPSGNVGIGTASPAARLEVKSPSDLHMRVGSIDQETSPIIRFQGQSSVGQKHYADIQLDAETGTLLLKDPGTSSTAIGQSPVAIDSDGNVGIGTTSPSEKLHVSGNAIITGDLNVSGTTTTVNTVTLSVEDHQIILGTLFSGTPTDLTADGGGVVLKGDTDKTILWSNSDDAWRCNQNFIADGNVGIGTTSPNSLLELRTAAGSGNMAEITLYSDGSNNNATSSIFLGQSLTRRAEITAIRTGSGNSHDLAFSTNAGAANPVEAMRIDSAGNVGIGTASPDNLLSVDGNISIWNGNRLWLKDGAGIAIENDDGNDAFYIKNIGGTDNSVLDLGSGKMVIDETSGNVGIGTTSPSARLTLPAGQAIHFDDSSAITKAAINSGAGGTLELQGNLDLRFKTTNEAMRIDSNGNVGIGTTSPSSLLELSSGDDTVLNITAANNKSSAIHFSDPDAQNQGIITYTHTSDSLRFFTQNTEQMRIDSDGNVGIGTTSPLARLDIRTKGDTTNDGLIVKTPTGGGRSVRMWIDGVNQKAHIGGGDGSQDLIINHAGGNVGIGTTSPSAPLEVSSTTGGVIMPRMTTIQRTAVSAVDGEMVYDTDLNKFFGYANGAWTALH